MLSGQDRVELSEGSLFHMLELYDEECETSASQHYIDIRIPIPYSHHPPMRYQVSAIVVDFIIIRGVGVDGLVNHCMLDTSSTSTLARKQAPWQPPATTSQCL